MLIQNGMIQIDCATGDGKYWLIYFKRRLKQLTGSELENFSASKLVL